MPDTRRFHEPEAEPGPLPDWWGGDDRPLIYLTFGSVFGGQPGAREAYRTAIDAVSDLPQQVLVTLGNADISVGAVPANVRVERWVPQDRVLNQARLVVCHGGSGTVLGSLAHGVPLVICPFFADQEANGRLVERAGAGSVFRSSHAQAGGIGVLISQDVAGLRASVAAAVVSESRRSTARLIGLEMAQTPALDRVVETWLGELELGREMEHEPRAPG